MKDLEREGGQELKGTYAKSYSLRATPNCTKIALYTNVLIDNTEA